jgi:hypothetical protein
MGKCTQTERKELSEKKANSLSVSVGFGLSVLSGGAINEDHGVPLRSYIIVRYRYGHIGQGINFFFTNTMDRVKDAARLLYIYTHEERSSLGDPPWMLGSSSGAMLMRPRNSTFFILF